MRDIDEIEQAARDEEAGQKPRAPVTMAEVKWLVAMIRELRTALGRCEEQRDACEYGAG